MARLNLPAFFRMRDWKPAFVSACGASKPEDVTGRQQSIGLSVLARKISMCAKLFAAYSSLAPKHAARVCSVPGHI